MIGSFWNLCRACPSMPVDKLHSEYRSTYRWHEYTGGPRQEIIRKPPVANQFANEPAMPRRKKCPELAYKTHEFIGGGDEQPTVKFRNDTSFDRARSGERGTPSRRSKSAGPPGKPISNGIINHLEGTLNGQAEHTDSHSGTNTNGQAGESSGLFRKTISKLSTEYRRQFIWPNIRRTIHGDVTDTVDPPRKSFSMGALKKVSHANEIPSVHKKRTTIVNEANVHELEPLVNNTNEVAPAVRRTGNISKERNRVNEYRIQQISSDKQRYGFAENGAVDGKTNKPLTNGCGPRGDAWLKEVVELRKKADEYKSRGWGKEIDPDLYRKQQELWEQVSRRNSLDALSLASSVQNRPITKEEKDKENNRKTSPTKAHGRFPGQAHPVDNKTVIDGFTLPNRSVRHHLERTTGPDVEEGALLPSPTREKLMPTIPRSKEEELYGYSSQRGSPKKSRHGSPQKGSPQKGSPKKIIKQPKGRSQSVGPTVTESGSSPKRQVRSGSTVPSGGVSAPTSAVSKNQKKSQPIPTPMTNGERRPRPTTLSTTNHNRSKSSSLPPTNGRFHSAPSGHNNQLHDQIHEKPSPSPLQQQVPNLRKTNKSVIKQRPKSTIDPMQQSMIRFEDIHPHLTKEPDNKTTNKLDDDGNAQLGASPMPTEYIIKSPPEPTRVKSPEQILMRSPDPVNWTVPLDTGKTFTVTQNVRNGDSMIRPYSELKASTPVDKPPLPSQSAPPQLAEQAKIDAIDTSKVDKLFTNIPEVRYDKPVPGSTLRCLDDPIFDPSPVAGK